MICDSQVVIVANLELGLCELDILFADSNFVYNEFEHYFAKIRVSKTSIQFDAQNDFAKM